MAVVEGAKVCHITPPRHPQRTHHSQSSMIIHSKDTAVTATAASSSATVEKESQQPTIRPRRTTASKAKSVKPKGSIKKRTIKKGSTKKSTRWTSVESSAPCVGVDLSTTAVVTPITIPGAAAPTDPAPSAAPSVPSWSSRLTAILCLESEDSLHVALKQLAWLLGVVLVLVVLTYGYIHSVTDWLVECKGDKQFDCATNYGRYVPLHENNGTCEVFTDMTRWHARACTDLWWVTEGEVHPPLTCQDLCHKYAPSHMGHSCLVLLALTLAWIVDAMVTALVPREVAGSTATLENPTMYLWCVLRQPLLALMDCQIIRRIGMVPQYSDGGLLFACTVLAVHLICAAAIILQVYVDGRRHTKSSYNRRGRYWTSPPPSTNQLQTVESGLIGFILVALAISTLLSWADFGGSDRGWWTNLIHCFTDYGYGGCTLVFAVVMAYSAILSKQQHKQWRLQQDFHMARALAAEVD